MTPQEILTVLRKRPVIVRRLRKVREFIRRHPRHLDMADWVTVRGDGKWGSETCGTVACVGGWYDVLSAKPKSGYGAYMRGQLFTDLGEEPGHLFYVSQWPEPYKSAHNRGDARQQASTTAKRITYFLRTGK